MIVQATRLKIASPTTMTLSTTSHRSKTSMILVARTGDAENSASMCNVPQLLAGLNRTFNGKPGEVVQRRGGNASSLSSEFDCGGARAIFARTFRPLFSMFRQRTLQQLTARRGQIGNHS